MAKKIGLSLNFESNQLKKKISDSKSDPQYLIRIPSSTIIVGQKQEYDQNVDDDWFSRFSSIVDYAGGGINKEFLTLTEASSMDSANQKNSTNLRVLDFWDLSKNVVFTPYSINFLSPGGLCHPGASPIGKNLIYIFSYL